MQKNRWSFET